jgi:hypothetical protein
MAGAGFRSFAVGEVLTAVNVNTFLMQQAVMVFDDAADRTADLAAPSEGMVSYLEDTNRLEVYRGSAWGGTGTVVRYASATETTQNTGTTNFDSVSIAYAAEDAANLLLIEASFVGFASNSASANIQERALRAKIRNVTDSVDVVLASVIGHNLIGVSTALATVQPSVLLRTVITAGATTSKTYTLQFLPLTNTACGALGDQQATRISVMEMRA